MTISARVLGSLVIALAVLPLYALLQDPETGLAGAATARIARLNVTTLWLGALLALLPAVLLARADSRHRLWERARAGAAWLHAVPPQRFALAAGALSAALTLAHALLINRRIPLLIDAMAQLVHARYIAAGIAVAPRPDHPEFWVLQQSILAPEGWQSQYPPGHAVALAVGMLLGTPWLVGAAMMFIAFAFLALALLRLGDSLALRIGLLLAACSPLLIGHAAGAMNHSTTAAALALAFYCAVRAGQGSAWWALPAGMFSAAAFTVRPLHALVISIPLVLGPWLVARLSLRPISLRLAAAAGGAAPLLLTLGAYNARWFGHPLRFGYVVAQGPSQRLGFHVDPWGNRYGAMDAVGYTSADLSAFSLGVLEAPIPVVTLAGVFLLLSRRIQPLHWLLIAWACLPVAANFLYWHHDPRLLSEAAPAWLILGVLGTGELLRRAPRRVSVGSVMLAPRSTLAAWWVLALLFGAAFLAPPRLQARALRARAAAAPELPRNAIVFAHGGWSTRVAMRLLAEGLRLDRVEAAIRQYPTCDLQQYLDAPVAQRPALDLRPRATDLPARVVMPSGDVLRMRPGDELSPACWRELAADRLGIVDPAPLLWRGSLPGVEDSRAMVVRDFGPERNARMLHAFPERTPYVLLRDLPDGPPRIAAYDDGMRILWEDGS